MPRIPGGREKNVSGQGKDIYKRGEGQGTGPVGNQNGYNGRPTNNGGGGNGPKRSGGGLNPISIIAAIALLLGGGGGLGSLLGGSETTTTTNNTNTNTNQNVPIVQQGTSLSTQMINSLSAGTAFSGNSTSTGWTAKDNNGVLDTTVNSKARSKYTTIKGNNKDTVTILIYMCGADLESRSGMGTSDISEIISSNLDNNPNVNVLLYTGGASKWQNSVVSNQTTQIYKLESGGVRKLEADMGDVSMTRPDTLAKFIQYGKKNYSANRMELIFWDHGGGSISGYGYDENFKSSGSMCLEEISEALSKGGVKFDFIGFDACLMATVENGLMLNSYADYMIASEETEPGVGWYYTNWLNQLVKSTSISTVELGKIIADDFVSVCGQQCRGQKTTLSVVDLAELSATVPQQLSSFASSTLDLIENNQYSTVAKARSGAREFASGNKIDQVDAVSFASNIKTDEATALSKALMGAVKYNRTSSDMTNAYGLSIYFPYKSASMVSDAVEEYEAIGMDSDYAECVKKFASMEVGGQAVSGGYSSPVYTLTTTQDGSYNSSSTQGYTQADMIAALLYQMMNGSTGNVSGLTSGNSGFLGKSLSPESDAKYLAENRFNTANLVWVKSSDGTPAMYLNEDQWNLVTNLELNLFFDDGKGYIDMGLDDVYEFTKDGGLVGEYDGTWIAINDQPVAYYHMDTVYDGNNYTITGRVPALLNGERVNLILVFDNANPYGYVAGASPVYTSGETDTVAKNLVEINDGDTIDFLCDYYSYAGRYQDSYMLGDQMTVEGKLTISNVYINRSAASPAYLFTDIYQQTYWSPVME